MFLLLMHNGSQSILKHPLRVRHSCLQDIFEHPPTSTPALYGRPNHLNATHSHILCALRTRLRSRLHGCSLHDRSTAWQAPPPSQPITLTASFARCAAPSAAACAAAFCRAYFAASAASEPWRLRSSLRSASTLSCCACACVGRWRGGWVFVCVCVLCTCVCVFSAFVHCYSGMRGIRSWYPLASTTQHCPNNEKMQLLLAPDTRGVC